MTVVESSNEQKRVIERIRANGVYTATLIRIGDDIYMIEQTDPEVIRAACALHDIPAANLHQYLSTGAVDIQVAVAIHRGTINQAIETHFAIEDKPVTPAELVDKHQIDLNPHPYFLPDEILEAQQRTLDCAQRLFPEFTVSLHQREATLVAA